MRSRLPDVIERVLECGGRGGLGRRSVHSILLSLSLSAFLGGCGGPQFTGTEYRDEEVAFRLGPVPSGLVQLETNEARLAFRNDEAGTTWAVKARCGLDGDDVPLDALIQHLFLHFTNRNEVVRKEFMLDGRAALEVEMEAKLDGVMQHFIVIVTKKNTCVYDFVHVDGGGMRPAVKRSRAEFRQMVQGFETLD